MTELVSIIVPAYNYNQYIQENIESILCQSHKNFEVIYIDDGSTDNSVEILRAYAGKDDRIRIIQQENHGVSYARNTGLKAARGAYITFADSDDYIDPRYVEVLLNSMKEADADISCCGLVLHRPDRTIPLHGDKKTEVWSNEEALVRLITGKSVEPSVWAKMFRREVLEGVYFNTSIKYNEDYLFDLCAFLNSKKTVFCGVPLYHYVLHENSATTKGAVLRSARDIVAVSEMALTMPFSEKVIDILQRKRHMGYFDSYNSLLYGKGAEFDSLKKEIRDKVVAEKQYYRTIALTKREKFFYLGITYCPGIYEYVFRGLKKITPDRRTFKI